jgi:hypothetical protein
MGVKNLLATLLRAHPADTALSAAADGSASDAARARVEAHASTCATCRARLDEYTSVRAMLASLPFEDAPRSFRLSPAHAAAPARPVPPARGGRALALRAMPALAAVAAVAFMALVGVDLIGGSNGNNATAGPQLAAVREAPSAASSGGQDKSLAPAPSSAQAPDNSSSGVAPPATPPAAGALADSATNATPPTEGQLYAASGTREAAAPAPRSAGTSATPPASTPVEGNAQASGAATTPPAGPSLKAAPTGAGGSGGGISAIRWAEAGTAAAALLSGIGAVVLWRRREEDS